MEKINLSDCCGFPVRTHSEGLKGYYTCEKCLKKCNIKPRDLEINVHDDIKLKDVGPGQI